MVYLYAALGVVMMTGIMAIVEMGLSLTGRQLFARKPDDPYQQNFWINSIGERDRQMLDLLHNQTDLDAIGRSLEGDALCEQLMCRSSSAPGAKLGCRQATVSMPANVVAVDADQRLPQLETLKRANSSPMPKACALEVDVHRLLIQPDPSPVDRKFPYRLFSCVTTETQPTCDVESGS